MQKGSKAASNLPPKDAPLALVGPFLSIVDAAGQDSQAGFPGIQPDSRRVSPATELVDGTYPGSSYQVISNTKWNTRAWTYQEMLLPKRILVKAWLLASAKRPKDQNDAIPVVS